MHNTYISSTIYSIRSKGSPSFSFNDYSYLLNERVDRTPLQSSSCCGCCACCAFSTHRVPTSSSFLYGLRQSTLLQWSASRRLILGGGDRFYYRLPVYGLDQGLHEVSCSLKESSVCNRSRRRRNVRCSCMLSEEESDICHSGRFDDAEAVLSLLSEDVGVEFFGGGGRSGYSRKTVEVEKRGNFGDRKRNLSSSRRVEVAKGVNIGGRERNVSSLKRDEVEKGRKIGGRKRNVSSSKRVELEKSESYDSECYSVKKKNVGLSSQETNSRNELELVALESREEDCRHNEERGTSSRSENHRGRKGGSSSSYHSFSSLGDFESDVEVEDKQGQFVEESSSGYRDSGKTGEYRYEGKMAEEYKRLKGDEDRQGGITEQKNTVLKNGVEWDWRKKSEKKLTELSVEETKSRSDSSQIHSQVSRIDGSNYRKSSTSHKQIEEEENSELVMNLNKGTRKQYGQTEDQVIGQPESRRKYTELPEFPASDAETTSLKKRSGVREGNTSDWQRQSDIRMKNREGNSNLVLSSVQQSEERRHQTGEWISEQIDSGRKYQQVTETSEFHDSNTENASIIQPGTRLKNKKENSDLVSTSSPEAKEIHPKTYRKAPMRIQSTKGSKNVTDISVVHASDIETVTDQGTSEKRINQKSTLTTLAKPIEEIRERHNQTHEMFMQIKSIKEGQRPTKLSTFCEETSEEASGFQASLNLVSQGRVQQVDAEEDKRGSNEKLMPPPSQLVSRGSLHVEMTSTNATPEISGETSESGSSAYYTRSGGRTPALHHEPYGRDGSSETYGEPLNLVTPEDALGSADRLEKSSMQYVGEFVEKVRHEVLTSEIQKEKKDSEIRLVTSKKYNQESSSEFVSNDSQLKEHDSRHSLGGSGTKGPSDEMWDVTNSSVQQAPQAEEPKDAATTGNAIVKRSGRSLWNIIADVIRLRWVSHAESPNSVARSGERSSSNKSASSETWFSGHGQEESTDENAKREKESMPPEVMSSDQQLHRKISSLSQGEASDTTRSKDEIRYHEADTSFLSSKSESGSASKGISLASGDENLSFGDDAKGFHGARSGMEIVGPSLSSPSKGIRRSSIAEEFSKAGETAASGSGSMEQMEEPVGARLTEISGTDGKGGKLKQRKFQRNKQVPRDRFDEWEEAYKLESEQRRFDEMFMREALLEAKKAADSWEVPVGAVLVQHGKIIARGCNL
jgi:tRNA(adenine34) deaminase